MKSNDDRCHLFVPNEGNVVINIANGTIESTNSIDLLAIKIDSKLILMNRCPFYVKRVIKSYTH